ncbi:hypothetical protein NP493_399g01006 [Ridgeia piscesae]|uniref:Uncharacterized protein n=1 Tax=Ridgeia piscesae TaxID=27915 RepID=A0AAD9L146_RIDPI|nr:hypothetical protein NP493_399g01006 [Ridgeia piscesae]
MASYDCLNFDHVIKSTYHRCDHLVRHDDIPDTEILDENIASVSQSSQQWFQGQQRSTSNYCTLPLHNEPDQKCVGLYVLSHRLTQGHARQSLHRNTALLIHTQQSLHQLASISRTCLCSLFFLGLLSLLWRHCSSSLQVNTGAVINCQTL